MPLAFQPALRLLAAAMLTAFLAGCGDDPPSVAAQDTTPSPADATPADATPPSAPAAPAAREYPADHAIDAPIPEDDIATDLTQDGAPRYVAADDTAIFRFEVGNWGNTALTGQGTHGVVLGVLHIGEDATEGRQVRVLGRTSLPLIPEGTTSTVEVKVPAADLIGLPLTAELFQRDVAWFGRNYGMPTVALGPFRRCDGSAGPLCDARGVALAAEVAP